MKLYDSPLSGNCYKVRLLLSHLDVEYERIGVDVVSRSGRVELLGEINPALRIPVVELDEGRHLAESNAILWYLGRGTEYLPSDPYIEARVLQWMFFEQNGLEPNVGGARYWLTIADQGDWRPELLKAKQDAGKTAIEVLERHLDAADWLVDGRYTIADIALYAYTHVAPEAGIELGPFPAVRAWIDRVRSRPGHLQMAGEESGTE